MIVAAMIHYLQRNTHPKQDAIHGNNKKSNQISIPSLGLYGTCKSYGLSSICIINIYFSISIDIFI